MAVTWTESFSSFTPVGTGWQDYDVYTNKGIPKDVVLDVVCANFADDLPNLLGVREDGSSLDRFGYYPKQDITQPLHEAEGGGCTTINMLVNVGSSGLIETYCSFVENTVFYILGYWSNVEFTETAHHIEYDYVSGWVDKNVYSLYSIPKGRTIQVSCSSNSPAYPYDGGVRTDGSSLERKLLIHEAEGVSTGGLYTNNYGTYVKSDSSTGIIECYFPANFNIKYHIWGYFGSEIDYEELWTQKSMGSDNTWESKDLTADLDEDGRVVNFVLVHEDANAETFCGARIYGSILERMIEEHEAETAGNTGFGTVVKSDVDGVVELYCEDASESLFMLAGYFIPVEGPLPGWKQLQYFTEPPSSAQFNKLRFASEPPVGGAWNKVLLEGE